MEWITLGFLTATLISLMTVIVIVLMEYQRQKFIRRQIAHQIHVQQMAEKEAEAKAKTDAKVAEVHWLKVK